MASNESPTELAKKCVMTYNMKLANEIADAAVSDKGSNLYDIVVNGLVAGMEEVGKLYSQRKVFLPQIISASNVFTCAYEKISPEMEARGEKISSKLGKVVICSIEGDVHTIGKDIVATMLRTAGFEVVNLGRDVPLENIVAACREQNADIVGTSALMTSTMALQKTLEEMLKLAGIRDKIKTNVGGSAVSATWADDIGADFYTSDADDAVSKYKQMIEAN